MSSFPMAAVATTQHLSTQIDEIELQEQIVAFKRDPLLFSVVAKRLAEENPNEYGFLSLQYNQDILNDNITAEDLHKTDAIRKFYMDRYLLSQLRRDKLSDFRKDLINYFYSNDVGQSVYQITDKTVGMMYKLPYFYEYDIQVAEVLVDYNDSDPVITEDSGPLEFVAKLDMHRKKITAFEYWFKDADNRRYAILLEKNNPLLPLFEDTIQTSKIKTIGIFERRTKNYNPYTFIKSWSFRV